MNEQIQQLYNRLQAGEQLTPEEMAMLRANYFTLPETQSFISGNNVGPWSSGYGSEPSDPTLPPLFDNRPSNNYYIDNLPGLTGETLFGRTAPLQPQYTRPGAFDNFGPLVMEGVEGTDIERGVRTAEIDPNAPFIVEDTYRGNDRMPNVFGDERVVGTDGQGNPIFAKQDAMNNLKKNQQLNQNMFPFMYPGGSDINTQLYSAGRGIGMEKGARGRGALIAGGLGAAALGTTRNLLAGIGYEKQQNYVRDWYQQRQRDLNYTAIDQSKDMNKTGGYNRNGGLFRTYEAGGMMEQPMSPEQQMAPEQGQEQQQMIQQIQMAVADMLQQGVQPEQVMQELVQQGIPEEAAMQLIQDVMMQMQGQQQQGVPQEMMPEAPMQGLPQEAQQAPLMKLGGKKVGDPISFKYGGKMHKGKIKKIENGKIYI
jgi:hypothetical protein